MEMPAAELNDFLIVKSQKCLKFKWVVIVFCHCKYSAILSFKCYHFGIFQNLQKATISLFRDECKLTDCIDFSSASCLDVLILLKTIQCIYTVYSFWLRFSIKFPGPRWGQETHTSKLNSFSYFQKCFF